MKPYAYIIAPILGWIIAQTIKFGLSLHKDGVTISDVVESGGMPSSHTAFMVALSTAVGLGEGFESVAFAISAAVTAIIMYDSLGVRRTTGDQTVAIEKLAKGQKTKIFIHNSKGHTPLQVFAGLVLGIAIGVFVNYIL